MTPGTGAPPTGASQLVPVTVDPARGAPISSPAGTVNVNDNRNSTWQTPPPDATVRTPQPYDNTQRIASSGNYGLGNYGVDRSGEFSPHSSSAAPPAWNDYSHRDPGSFAGSQGAYGTEPYVRTEDAFRLGVPDTLASALGFNPSPNRVVSYEQDVKPIVRSEDFWSSLAAARNDRSLDYLEDDGGSAEPAKPGWPLTLAVFALFASIGGNLFMGWVTLDIYRKSLDLADDGINEDRYEARSDRDEDDAWSESRERRARSSVRV